MNSSVRQVFLDRPEKANALTSAHLEKLRADFAALRDDPDVRVVVLAGKGKTFCGGADISELKALTAQTAGAFVEKIHQVCAAIRELPVPVVAQLHGAVIGAGLEIAAACDLRVAAEGTKFSMPEVRLGIPSVVEAAMLPRLVGTGRARWLLMTGATVGAAEALVWGLIEKLSPAEKLDETVDHALDAILAGEPEAIRAQKRLCKLWEEAPLAESVRASIDEFAKSYESGEPRRRVAAFRAARRKRSAA